MKQNLIKTINETFDKNKSTIEAAQIKDFRMDKFIDLVDILCSKGAVSFQLDDRLINSFNKDTSLLKYPIAKILDKDNIIMSYIDIKKWGLSIATVDNILTLFNLQRID